MFRSKRWRPLSKAQPPTPLETIFSYRPVGLEHQANTGVFYAVHVGTATPHDSRDQVSARSAILNANL